MNLICLRRAGGPAQHHTKMNQHQHLQMAIREIETERDRLSALVDGLRSYAAKAGARLEVAGAPASPPAGESVAVSVGAVHGQARPVLEVVSPAVDLSGDNSEWNPTDRHGVALGLSLPQPFTATDLRSRFDAAKDGTDPATRGYRWVASWKSQGWVETVAYATYRRTDKFGKLTKGNGNG